METEPRERYEKYRKHLTLGDLVRMFWLPLTNLILVPSSVVGFIAKHDAAGSLEQHSNAEKIGIYTAGALLEFSRLRLYFHVINSLYNSTIY